MSDEEADPPAAADNGVRPAVVQRHTPRIEPPGELVLNNDRELNFDRFLSRWKPYYILSRLSEEPVEYQTALLLYTVGADAAKVVLNSAKCQADKSLKSILEILKQYCVGERNIVHERYRFNTRVQQPGEQFDAFYSELRSLADRCAYDYLAANDGQLPADEMLRDRIILGVTNDAVRKKLISQGNKLTLADAVKVCRSYEVTSTVMKSVSKGESIDAVRKTSNSNRGKNLHATRRETNTTKSHAPEFKRTTPQGQKCTRCGRGPHAKKDCPAKDAECRTCKRKGHYAACCRTKSLQEVTTQDEPHCMFTGELTNVQVDCWTQVLMEL